MPHAELKIISGGQTGADRAALDAAMAAHVPCGGWCPHDRLAEDGRIPPQYPVSELPGAGYPERTRRNVQDSDGTLIVSFGAPQRGTALTFRCCQEAHKPCLVLDAAVTSISDAVGQLAAFVSRHQIKTLNVAGPRASEQPGIYDYVNRLLSEYLAANARA
jgi:hypothetical protein